MIDFDVVMNPATVTARVSGVFEYNQEALDTQVLKDSNFFIPFERGILMQSGILYSDLGSGEVKWVAPYARRQYWELPNKSLDDNVHARMKWFEEAKAVYFKDWLDIAGRNM